MNICDPSLVRQRDGAPRSHCNCVHTPWCGRDLGRGTEGGEGRASAWVNLGTGSLRLSTASEARSSNLPAATAYLGVGSTVRMHLSIAL